MKKKSAMEKTSYRTQSTERTLSRNIRYHNWTTQQSPESHQQDQRTYLRSSQTRSIRSLLSGLERTRTHASRVNHSTTTNTKTNAKKHISKKQNSKNRTESEIETRIISSVYPNSKIILSHVTF